MSYLNTKSPQNKSFHEKIQMADIIDEGPGEVDRVVANGAKFKIESLTPTLTVFSVVFSDWGMRAYLRQQKLFFDFTDTS